MIRTMLFNILLKRGASALEEFVGKGVRHGMTTYGGVLMSEGFASGDQVQALTGGAVAVAGILLSIARTYVQKKYG